MRALSRNNKGTTDVLESTLKKFGFKRFEKIKVENKEGKKLSITETIIGFYRDEHKYTAYIHYNTNKELLGNYLKTRLKELKKIDAIYEGENYTLIKQKDNFSAFNSKFLRNIKEAIASLGNGFPYRIKEYQTVLDRTILGILMEDNSLFIIAGMHGYEYQMAEERLILTDKVDAAQSFFNLDPHKKVDWTKLKEPKGKHFEALCEAILSRQQNLVDIQPVGKTNAPDRGRDFIVKEKTKDIDGKTREIKWLVQCKFSKKSISPKIVPDWTTRVLEHKVDGYWLITNNDITPDLYDQLNDVGLTTKISIETRLWQRNKFNTFFYTRPDLFTKDNFK